MNRAPSRVLLHLVELRFGNRQILLVIRSVDVKQRQPGARGIDAIAPSKVCEYAAGPEKYLTHGVA